MSAAIRAESDRFRIVNALNADWGALALNHHDRVERWAAEHSVLVGCHDLVDVLDEVRGNPDGVLFALLSEDAAGDAIAGRVILQAMLGKVVKLTLRDSRRPADDYVGAIWCLIRTYPLHARPTRIAANLALDALKAVSQEAQSTRRFLELVTLEPGARLEQLHAEAVARVDADHNAEIAAMTANRVIATADKLGLIDLRTREVLLSVYSDGLSGRDAAELHQTSHAMIRFRCSRAVRRLAQSRVALVEAA